MKHLITIYPYIQIQTAGGAQYQEGTICTTATYSPYDQTSGDGDIGYSCIVEETGRFSNATGEIYGIPRTTEYYHMQKEYIHKSLNEE